MTGGGDERRIAELIAAAFPGSAPPVAITPLSGTGNRSYRVAAGSVTVVVRLPGDDTGTLVDRTVERRNAEIAASLGLAPRLLYADPGDGAMVVEYVSGRTLADLYGSERLAALERLGRAFARLQNGPALSGIMDPWAKILLYLDLAGCGGGSPQAFGSLWSRLQHLRRRTGLDSGKLVPCHVDPVPENVLDDGSETRLVDWEYAAMSGPLWDIAYLCVEGRLDARETEALLLGYGTNSADADLLEDWKRLAEAVSAAWCMARAAASGGHRDLWRRQVEKRLAALARALDDPAGHKEAP